MSLLMGIDYGISKVGIAVIDEEAHTPAIPVTVLKLTKTNQFVQKFSLLLKEYPSKIIVVGNPYVHIHPSIKERVSFKKFLLDIEHASGAKPILFDEVMTTRVAQHLANIHPQKVKDDDAIAASLMLQSYIDSLKRK